MNTIYLLLLLFGAVCFFVSAIGGSIHPKVHLQSAGLFLWILVPLIEAFRAL